MATAKGYIESYQLLELSPEDGLPFQLMLITTYPNQEQYDLREDHFQELIKEKGPLNLLNDKQPAKFRKSFFTAETVKHWF